MNSQRDHISALDDFRLEVHAGNDLIARFPNALVLMRMPLPRERDVAAQVVELCRVQPAIQGHDGRSLLRKVAGILAAAEPEDVPAFALVTPIGGRTAVLLHGDVNITVSAHVEQRLAGLDSATWVDRIIDSSFDRMHARVHEPASPSSPEFSEFPLDLREGTVPGAGWTLIRRLSDQEMHSEAGARDDAGQMQQATTVRTALEAPFASSALPGGTLVPELAELADTPTELALPRSFVSAPAAESAGHPVMTPPPAAMSFPPEFESVLLVGEPTAKSDRQPLPISPEEPEAEAEAEAENGNMPQTGAPEVEGILCANGHFNDPDALYCRIDGISLAQRTHSFVTQPRPPLGVLVFDDGSSYSVDSGYVLGREPEQDENVLSGRVRPLVVLDEEETVSRIHAEIRIEGWNPEILDRGSANGTYIAPPGSTIWTPLPPKTPTPLVPGTRVEMGGRWFVYDSHLKI
jgi:hypothetical protein